MNEIVCGNTFGKFCFVKNAQRAHDHLVLVSLYSVVIAVLFDFESQKHSLLSAQKMLERIVDPSLQRSNSLRCQSIIFHL